MAGERFNILCVIDSLGSGGAQRQLVNLALNYKKRGHSVSFLIYHPLNFYSELLLRNDIQIKRIDEQSKLKRFFKIRRYIIEGKFDIVQSFLDTPNFYCECAGFPFRRWKLIVGERSANPQIGKSFKLKFLRWMHIFADFVVANSTENLNMVKRVNPYINPDKLKVIYNLVDFPQDIISNRVGLNTRTLLLVAASHQKLKNLNGLVEAVKLLSQKEKTKLCIHWYGDKADSSFVEAYEKIRMYKLESIFTFFDATLDIKDRMLEADVIGLFSFYEGLPNTICEGMALGKPIICAAVSDIPLIFEDSPQCLFNPSRIIDITNVLSFMLSLSKAEMVEMGEANLVKANKLFNKDVIVTKYLELMNRI